MFASTTAADVQVGDQITLEFEGCHPSRVVKTNYLQDASADAENRAGGNYAIAGKLNWVGTNVQTFCIQVGEGLVYGASMDYTYMSLQDAPEDPPYTGGMGSMRATMMRDLYSRYWSEVSDADRYSDAGRDVCAAFQAMIWEITHENLSSATDGLPDAGTVSEINLTLGAMQTNNMTIEATALFSEMKGNLGQDGWLDYYGDSLWGLSNPNYQDQIYLVPGAAVGLAGIGLFGARRRRNR
ncbi:MAG: hypothetical protein MK085_00335 [Phycisphaerales bacterium]|nr:hypothetical protein [Phycisphaerales bacterium]